MLVVPTITAQNATDEIQYKITGRMLMDGGIYLKNPVDFGNGTEFNDLRIGMKATYRNWKMKLEMGYAGNKAAIKDAFATYSYKKHSIQVGQFYEPFSLDMLCSTFDLRFNQSPGVVLALTNSRRMGVAYSYNAKHYYLCGGLFTDNDLSNLKNVSQGYAIDTRLVYRPVYEKGKLIHLGVAATRRTPDGVLPEDGNKDTFTYKSVGVSTIDNRTLVVANVDNAVSQFKIGTELLIYYHKFFLQVNTSVLMSIDNIILEIMWHRERIYNVPGYCWGIIICMMKKWRVREDRKEKALNCARDLIISL